MVNGPRRKNTTTGANRGSLAIAIALAGIAIGALIVILEEHAIETVLRDYQITPPAITTAGARSVMKRL